jgi:hypothetical protein
MEVKTLADIKLVGRSVNEDWPVSPELRETVISQLHDLAASGDPDLAIAASKVIIAADALNIRKREAEQKRLEAEHARKLQLIELAVRVGIIGNDGETARAMDSVASAGK